MQPMLNTAVKAALNAGKLITRHYERLPDQSVTQKNGHTYTTTINQAANKEIIELLQKSYPDHAIMTEEPSGESNSEFTWIVDSINGTLNYIHGLPQLCVAIALQHKHRIVHAVIYDPLQQELFTASRGKGAQLNNRRLRVTTQAFIEDALLACPFPTLKPTTTTTQLTVLQMLQQHTSGLRYTGSAALTLAYVAAGRLDGYWDNALNLGDFAAGSLLVEEAGGLVSDWHANPNYLVASQIIAANPKLFKLLLPVVQQGFQ